MGAAGRTDAETGKWNAEAAISWGLAGGRAFREQQHSAPGVTGAGRCVGPHWLRSAQQPAGAGVSLTGDWKTAHADGGTANSRAAAHARIWANTLMPLFYAGGVDPVRAPCSTIRMGAKSGPANCYNGCGRHGARDRANLPSATEFPFFRSLPFPPGSDSSLSVLHFRRLNRRQCPKPSRD